jgi:hypothetical protein
MNPRDALHQQELLREAAASNQGMRDFLSSVLTDIRDKGNGPGLADAKGQITPEIVGDSLAHLLANAETFYVSEDMTMVAEAAAHGLDGLDQFTHDMWPTDTGFLLFERGYAVSDVWGRPLVTTAFAWERRSFKGRAGTMVWSFTMLGDQRDAMSATLTPAQELELAVAWGSRLQLNATSWIADGQRVGPPTFPTPEGYAEAHREPEVEATLRPEHRVLEAMPYSQNPARLILSLLMLMQQTIAAKEKTDLRPKNPKRARRMKVPGQVTIIRLRHESNASGRQPGESLVEWQHRWYVRGFWRWQACGPHYPMAIEVGPGKFRSRIYIAPYVKGPEGAPIKQSKKVNALVR